MPPGCSDYGSDVFQKYHGKPGNFSLGIYLKLSKTGSVDIVSNVKCSPKTTQENTEEFNVEFRLPESESSASDMVISQ